MSPLATSADADKTEEARNYCIDSQLDFKAFPSSVNLISARTCVTKKIDLSLLHL